MDSNFISIGSIMEITGGDSFFVRKSSPDQTTKGTTLGDDNTSSVKELTGGSLFLARGDESQSCTIDDGWADTINYNDIKFGGGIGIHYDQIRTEPKLSNIKGARIAYLELDSDEEEFPYLATGRIITHKNGILSDNRLENLELTR